MKSNRRDFMKYSVGGMGAGALSAALPRLSAQTPNSRTRKNVLFIVVEDLKNIMGCYGNPLVQTPNIDRLAQKGVVFERAYCQYPVCNPSRTSFLTGLRPETTTILGNSPYWKESPVKDQVTLPHLFKKNGYYTAGLGKVFHGTGKHGDDQAWDEQHYFNATETGLQGESRNMTGGTIEWCRWLAAKGDDLDQPDGRIAQKGIEILRRSRKNPLFLALGFRKPHDPFHAPAKYFDLYPLDKLMPPVVPDSQNWEYEYTFGGNWKSEFDKFDLRDRREFLRSYYACVTFMDAQVGKVLDELDRQNLWKDTAVVFFGDHGYQLGEHNWWNKSVLFEGSARVPLIAAVEGESLTGRRSNGLVELVDLYPTLADICGLEPPANLEGISFKPLLRSPNKPWKKAAYTQVERRDGTSGKSIRTDRWRYNQWSRNGKIIGTGLYDHASDPGEYRNLAKMADFEDVCREMSWLLENGHNQMKPPADGTDHRVKYPPR